MEKRVEFPSNGHVSREDFASVSADDGAARVCTNALPNDTMRRTTHNGAEAAVPWRPILELFRQYL